MSGRPSWKLAEFGLFRPFSAFFTLFRRVRGAPGKSRKQRKKAFFLRYPRISLNPHLLNPHFLDFLDFFWTCSGSGIAGGPKLLSGDFFETFRVFGVLDSVDGGGDLNVGMVIGKLPRPSLPCCFFRITEEGGVEFNQEPLNAP